MTLLDDFDALTVQRIEEYIARRQEEHLSLDFKRLTSPDLGKPDRDNFARCLSGFANAVGGIVVWGVTTGRLTGRADVAAGRAEIEDLALAVGRLNEFTGILVSPSVDGVRHKKLETSTNQGFAATLIPISDTGPHMALAGVHGYYKRNGDRFVPMEHFEIADMFGRRRRPALQVTFTLAPGRKTDAFGEVKIDLWLENLGRGSAFAPYVDLFAEPWQEVMTSARGIATDISLMQPLSSEAKHVFLGRSDLVIHPGIRFHFARVVWRIQFNEQDMQWADVQIMCRIAADGAPLREQILTISRVDLAATLGFNIGGA